MVAQALFLPIGGVSGFASAAVGRAYLNGLTDVMQMEFPLAMTVVFLLGIGLALVGNLVLGWAVARSGLLPAWTGVAWALSALLFYLLGAVLGMATTGSSLPTQPLGAALMTVSGGWIALSARRESGGVPLPAAGVSGG